MQKRFSSYTRFHSSLSLSFFDVSSFKVTRILINLVEYFKECLHVAAQRGMGGRLAPTSLDTDTDVVCCVSQTLQIPTMLALSYLASKHSWRVSHSKNGLDELSRALSLFFPPKKSRNQIFKTSVHWR